MTDTPIPGPTMTLKNGEEYLRWRREQGFDGHLAKHLDLVFAELARLREFEAREAVVTNLFAVFYAAGEGKISDEQLVGVINSMDQDIADAIHALGRRDKIRKLEGAVEVLQTVLAGASIADTLIEHTQQLAEARAGK